MTKQIMNKFLINYFLNEDAPCGDVTTEAIFGGKLKRAEGIFLAKQDLVLSGMAAVQEILRHEFPGVRLKPQKKDGAVLSKGTDFAILSGDIKKILLAERLCLNVLQRLSGIATLTNQFVRLAKPHGVKIMDTRKTTPGLRDVEKQAVHDGGGDNHRMSLSDQYLIKDNHIAAAGSVTNALQRVLDHRKKHRTKFLVEVEVINLKQLREVLSLHPDIVLLDNMTVAMIRNAVRIRDEISRLPRAQSAAPLLEISGGMTLKNIGRFLPLGVDRISIGALTHSAPAVDISLEVTL